jgi:Fe-S-cluster-containing dehydrogenase component
VQQDVCNGCGYCVPACPFGVIDVSTLDGKAHKCTLCYDRLKGGLEPACAKSCPTNSIQFGEVTELRQLQPILLTCRMPRPAFSLRFSIQRCGNGSARQLKM